MQHVFFLNVAICFNICRNVSCVLCPFKSLEGSNAAASSSSLQVRISEPFVCRFVAPVRSHYCCSTGHICKHVCFVAVRNFLLSVVLWLALGSVVSLRFVRAGARVCRLSPCLPLLGVLAPGLGHSPSAVHRCCCTFVLSRGVVGRSCPTASASLIPVTCGLSV